MGRHARSENQKIVRNLGESAGAAEIGSTIFPFGAPPASMPSVGTRRSTRVFVPKAPAMAAGGDGGQVARVLRSGKRLAVSEHSPQKKAEGGDGDRVEWLRVLGDAGDSADMRWWKGEGDSVHLRGGDEPREPAAPESDAGGPDEFLVSANRRGSEGSLEGKKFGIVYNRKRRRPRSDSAVPSPSGAGDRDFEKDRKYGIVFTRKQCRKKPKVEPLVQEVLGEAGKIDRDKEEISRRRGRGEKEIRTIESARNFAEKVGISEDDIWTGVSGSMVLAVLIDSSCSSSSHQFSRLFISVVSWMKRARVRFWQFAALLLSESIAGAFSLNGVHFLPVRRHNNVFFSNAVPACGLCKIYGARKSIPLLSLDFSAIPFFFKSLHVSMALGSQYLLGVLARSVWGLQTSFPVAVRYEEYDSHIPGASFSGTEVPVSVIPAVDESHKLVGRSAVIVHGSRLRKHQRKRSSFRHSRSRHPFPMKSHPGAFLDAKTLTSRDTFVEPIHVKTIESCVSDFLSNRYDSDVSTPLGSHEKHRKSSIKSPVEGIKELRLALAEVKQNMDSAHCNANVLVTVSDRCWREEGADVTLEFSPSKDWCIAVKVSGMTRYLHKPQDMRPCVVNRFTHAYMWSGEDGWKLEFYDKLDWLVFKELHLECRERNSQSSQDVSVRVIPVPGVCEVSDYDDSFPASFARPDGYIKMTVTDEVGRALASDAANYDLDSGDEEWLKQLKPSSSDVENRGFSHISYETFEKIIFVLEKDVYSNPSDIYDKERGLDLCQNLGNRDMLAAVYNYWVEKRNQKCEALVRVFQQYIPTLRRAQLTQRPLLRRKRSFKRQRSQSGRGKPGIFSEAGTKEETSRRVHEAENAADRALESAIQLRGRAQVLMANAELAAYKSVMALKIADAIGVSESPDLASSILD